MINVTIGGQDYRLRFDLDAMEQIEARYGGLKEMLEAMKDGTKRTNMVKSLFVILANSALDYEGKEPNITAEVLRHIQIPDFGKLGDAIEEAMREGMHTETMNGGEADDATHDAYLEEIEKDEKKG